MDTVPFSDVLDLVEQRGWRLTRIWRPYRVFTRPGKRSLPILVEVVEGRVRRSDVERITKILDEGEA